MAAVFAVGIENEPLHLLAGHAEHDHFVVEWVNAIDILHGDGAFLQVVDTHPARVLEGEVGTAHLADGIGYHAAQLLRVLKLGLRRRDRLVQGGRVVEPVHQLPDFGFFLPYLADIQHNGLFIDNLVAFHL